MDRPLERLLLYVQREMSQEYYSSEDVGADMQEQNAACVTNFFIMHVLK